ncbi:hypothetical protein KDN24_06795 [Bacillus sp. Bva_UNVM-123]|uniref:hypothetical protein n=1 Tax=Bacillus sp. Bva_UNVM-123 TaxID=2829798 RepID=UPI00391F9640
MGQLVLWTSIVGLRNAKSNKSFYAYSEKTEMNNLQITIPFSAVCTYEESPNRKEGIQFYCYQKEIW